ncbi:MAG: CbtA family protein [Actinomycetota bacterium]
MVRALVARGLVIGLIAGLLAGAFAYAVGEPRIDRAIALEEQHAAAEAAAHPAAHEEEEPPVSRDGQRGGLFLATSLTGVALGGIFAVAFAAARGRVGPRRDAALSLTLAAALFTGAVLVPFAKYPANPPAVGDPDTITRRTLLYLALVAIGLLAVLAASRVARRAAPAVRAAAATATFAALVAGAYLALPTVNEVPDGFPADLLWEFRLASLGTQLMLWAALALGFAVAGERAARRASPAPA